MRGRARHRGSKHRHRRRNSSGSSTDAAGSNSSHGGGTADHHREAAERRARGSLSGRRSHAVADSGGRSVQSHKSTASEGQSSGVHRRAVPPTGSSAPTSAVLCAERSAACRAWCIAACSARVGSERVLSHAPLVCVQAAPVRAREERTTAPRANACTRMALGVGQAGFACPGSERSLPLIHRDSLHRSLSRAPHQPTAVEPQQRRSSPDPARRLCSSAPLPPRRAVCLPACLPPARVQARSSIRPSVEIGDEAVQQQLRQRQRRTAIAAIAQRAKGRQDSAATIDSCDPSLCSLRRLNRHVRRHV